MPSADLRSAYIIQLNELVSESTKDAISGHNLMCIIRYYLVTSNEILVGLAFKVVDVSEDLRKKMGLPPVNDFNR